MLKASIILHANKKAPILYLHEYFSIFFSTYNLIHITIIFSQKINRRSFKNSEVISNNLFLQRRQFYALPTFCKNKLFEITSLFLKDLRLIFWEKIIVISGNCGLVCSVVEFGNIFFGTLSGILAFILFMKMQVRFLKHLESIFIIQEPI
jgi:hypothetical protein